MDIPSGFRPIRRSSLSVDIRMGVIQWYLQGKQFLTGNISVNAKPTS